MFDHRHYVPVLKGKRAEFPAVQHVQSHEHITPLFEAIPTQKADYVPARMSSFWDNDRPYFIDLLFLDDESFEEADSDSHPIRICFHEVQEKGQFAIPVTGTARSPGYQAAVAAIVAEQQRGFAIRLVPEDFEDEDELGDALEALVELIGASHTDVDVVIDADTVASMSTAAVAQMHRANIAILPHIEQWRTLTVVAGAFPMSLSPLTRDMWNSETRVDWHGWRRVIERPRGIGRLPTYGDYTIAHPDLPPTGRATILAQLRYTSPDEFLIWKGHNVFTHADKFTQFFDICADLIQMPEYAGQAFSHGDAEIYEKATTRDSPGNAETWRKIGTNHHIETVKDQIANLPSA
ncbi:MAG: hypothetical protein DWQ34_13260 [Planctomycetota bacterium]|nr:MAG: hypothetical protein DWQ34_13260 [Planctomycetota bacterium]